jgi:two-component system sensor histidine kinase BaeS
MLGGNGGGNVEVVSAIRGRLTDNMRRAMESRPASAPRLSLVNQLVLLLVGAVLVAVTALGAAVAWNLRAGFSDYLRAQDEDFLERFVLAAADAVAQRGLDALQGPGSLRPLFEAVAPSNGEPPRPPREEGEPGRPPRLGPPGPPGAPPPAALRISGRIGVFDPQGRHLAGRRMDEAEVMLRRPIVVAGQTVAQAWLAQGRRANEAVDAGFLARQYRGILVTAGVLVLLAVAGAVWIGRRWLRPVQDVQQAARRVAQGAFDVRLQERGGRELAELARDINAMAASLQQLETARRRWIAELSHEMRTPLAVLRGEVEALIDGVRPLGRDALLSLQEEVARVTRLVEDLHQLALSDLRALPCHFAPLQPLALAQAAVARVQERARGAGMVLTMDTPPVLPTANWDHQRMEQLLSNLLENSLRYTDAPGRVVLSLAPAGADHLRLTVDDSPPGVSAGDLQRLFEPLYRADPSRSRRSGGSGLGLAICSAIVRSHGGRIAAERSPLGGLRIVATLPLQPEGRA